MILMVQPRDQRIAGKDHESEAVMLVMTMTALAISRDLVVYTCLSKSRSGSLLRPLFANLRSAFAFVLSTSLTRSDVRPYSAPSESKTWQLPARRCVSKNQKNFGGWKEL